MNAWIILAQTIRKLNGEQPLRFYEQKKLEDFA
jgi:hypothetical protein